MPLHHVPLAAQVDVRHVRLLLEHRAHQLREVGVDLHHLLELVQDQPDLALALRGELGRKLQQALEGRVHVLRPAPGLEAEAHRPVLGIDGDGGRDPQAAEHLEPLLGPEQDRRDVLVDLLRQLLGELLLRGRGHQVDLGHQHPAPHQLLRRPPRQGGFPVAARGEDHDVLAVQDIGAKLCDLVLAVHEGVVEREGTEPEWIAVFGIVGH